MSEVIPVMTNNYEENILKGVRDSSYSLESSLELLQKDVVQLHAPRYQSMRRVRLLCALAELDFLNTWLFLVALRANPACLFSHLLHEGFVGLCLWGLV